MESNTKKTQGICCNVVSFENKGGHKVCGHWEWGGDMPKRRRIWNPWREEIGGECDQHTLYDSLKELKEIKQKLSFKKYKC